MKIAVGSDSMQHIAETVIKHLTDKEITVVRCGALTGQTSDYVNSALAVGQAVAAGECDFAVCLCNTGTGASIIANLA